MTYYDDDRTATTATLSSTLLHLLRNDVDNDISQGNDQSIGETNNEPRDIENIDAARSSRNQAEEIVAAYSWLRQASERKAKSDPVTNAGKDVILPEETLVTNAIQEDDQDKRQRNSSTQTYLRATTMRGIPLGRLSSQRMMRGFYVTRSENGLSTAPEFTMPYDSTESQRTETTLIPDVSTTDDSVTTVLSTINDTFEREDFLEAVTTLAAPVIKRGKSLPNFDYVSSTTPTLRRKIALALSRYDEATTPLWTGRRIVVGKRNRRTTLSPIKEAVRRTESDFTQTTASVLSRNTSGTLMTTMTTPAMTIASENTFDIHDVSGDFGNFADRMVDDLEKRADSTTVYSLTKPTTPISSKLTSTTDDDTIVFVATATTAVNDPTVATTPAIVNESVNTTPQSSTVTVAEIASTDNEIETTSEIANYSAIYTLATTAKINSVASEYATTTITPDHITVEIDTVPTIANYSVTTMNPLIVNPYEFTTDFETETTLETTSSMAVETVYTTVNHSALVTPGITNTHETTTIPTIRTLTATVASTMDMRTDTVAPETTRDLAETNTNAVTTNATSTITSATVIDPTTTDPSATSTNVNASFAVTSATLTNTADTLTINYATSKFPVASGTDATLASLPVLNNVSSESSTTPRLTIFHDSTLFDISVNTTEFTTMFETSPTSLTLPHITVISQPPSNTIPETSTRVVTVASSIQTYDNLTSWTDAEILPTFSSIATSTTKDTTTYRSSIVDTDTIIPTVTSKVHESPRSVQMMDKEMTLSKMSVERDFKESNSDINRYNGTNSLRTASEERTLPETLPETRAIFDEPHLKNAQTRAGNRTFSELDANSHAAFGQKASSRRVLNRANNWIGRPVPVPQTQQSIGSHYPRRRVTVHRYRGRPRRPSDYNSSSKIVEENHRRRVVQNELGIRSDMISSATVKPENISNERVTQNPVRTMTRRMKVLKRIREKIAEENATVLPLQETTFTRVGGRRRQVVVKKFRLSQSEENSTDREIEEIGADSVDKSPWNGTQTNLTNLRINETFIPEQKKTRRRMRLVLKSIRPKYEEEDTTEETNFSNHDDKTPRNNPRATDNPNEFYTSDKLPGDANARKSRMRVVLKSVRPKSEEKNVSTQESNANFGFRSDNAHFIQDDFPRNLRVNENLGAEENPRRRTRVVLKRVKPKFEQEKTVAEKVGNASAGAIEESLQSTTLSNRHEGKNLSVQCSNAERRIKDVSKSAESKSETNSTEKASDDILEEAYARGETGVASDSVRSKLAEDSTAEETNTDLDFAAEEPRVAFPNNNRLVSENNLSVSDNFSSNLRMDGNFSNVEQTREKIESSYKNERTMIKQSGGFHAELHAKSFARIEEDTDRLTLEVSAVLSIEDSFLSIFI